VGYLREWYTGGLYLMKIPCREAFESGSRRATIPAAVLRGRLTSVTEPARGLDYGHHIADVVAKELEEGGAAVRRPGFPRTDPMNVEEAVAARYADQPELLQAVLKSVRDFVALAENKQRGTGLPCTIVLA
jgi:hypothetical protein